MAGGIAAEQSEHARTAQVSLQPGLAGDDVEVNVLKAFRFGEQRHVGLAAADHIPQRGADGSEQWSQIRGFIGGEVIERDGMTARDKHQPAGQRRAECVGNAPSRAQVDPLSCRQVCPRTVGTAHAPWSPGTSRIVPGTGFPLPSGKSLTAANPPAQARRTPSRRAPCPVRSKCGRCLVQASPDGWGRGRCCLSGGRSFVSPQRRQRRQYYAPRAARRCRRRAGAGGDVLEGGPPLGEQGEPVGGSRQPPCQWSV